MNINLRCAKEPAFMSLSRTAFKQGAKIGKYVGIYFIYLKKTGSCAFKNGRIVQIQRIYITFAAR